MRQLIDRFPVAFSFAGEQREIVRTIAELVEQQRGLGSVFYDMWFEAEVAGSAGDLAASLCYVGH